MALYPQWRSDAHPADHLLFDVGYGYAMITQAELLLKEVRERFWEDDLLFEKIDDLLERMESLKRGRLQLVGEVYAAAQEAANRGTPQSTGEIKHLLGFRLPLSNGWGLAEVCGGWMLDGKLRVLLAWPSSDNPKQLFNEDLEQCLARQKES